MHIYKGDDLVAILMIIATLYEQEVMLSLDFIYRFGAVACKICALSIRYASANKLRKRHSVKRY